MDTPLSHGLHLAITSPLTTPTSHFSQIPLLAYEDGQLTVNLGPAMVGLLEEAKWIRTLRLKVPDAFHTLSMADVKHTHDRIKVTLHLANDGGGAHFNFNDGGVAADG